MNDAYAVHATTSQSAMRELVRHTTVRTSVPCGAGTHCTTSLATLRVSHKSGHEQRIPRTLPPPRAGNGVACFCPTLTQSCRKYVKTRAIPPASGRSFLPLSHTHLNKRISPRGYPPRPRRVWRPGMDFACDSATYMRHTRGLAHTTSSKRRVSACLGL